MEREQEFEDDKIRTWKARAGERPQRDPTVMDVDLEREELYESRTYSLRPEALTGLGLAAVLTDPAGDAREPLISHLGIHEASLKLLAKQDRADKQITSILVSVFYGERTLLDRWDRIDEPEFRRRVRALNEMAVERGPFESPLVVTLEEWRQYEATARGPGGESR